VIIELGFSPDQSRQVNHWPDRVLVKDRLGMSAKQLRQTQDWIKSQVLIKRLAKPEEIAEAVLYLSSSGSAFVVGAEIVIDGGMTL
jgi:NAD(P)-dependent dehydrogenase (short-subunit alcohol dehydrogenase family)